MKPSLVLSALGIVLIGSTLFGQDSQTVRLDHKLQIPGATLKPGEYTFAVEDRLQDRAIIRITNTKKNSHELVLAVPSDKLHQAEHGKLIFFPGTGSDKQILQGWICPSCQSALEVVYPKGEAVKITSESAKPVLAVDPTYDKLPKNLSPDDMKVVTLWLLSPKEITPEQKGKGVEAAKYAEIRNNGQHTQVAGMPSQAETKTAATDTETPKALDRAVAPPPEAQATTNSNATTPASDSTSAASSPAPGPSADTASSTAVATAPAKTPDSTPATDRPLRDNRVPATATADTKPEAASNLNEPTTVARARRMPHTASNMYTFELVGFTLLLAGIASYIQRRFFPTFLKMRE